MCSYLSNEECLSLSSDNGSIEVDNEMDIDVELESAGKEAYSGHTVEGNVIHLHFNTRTKGSA